MLEILILFAVMGAATVFYVNLLLFSLEKSTGKLPAAEHHTGKNLNSHSRNEDESEVVDTKKTSFGHARSTSVKEYARISGSGRTFLSYDPLSASGQLATASDSHVSRPHSGIYF